MVIDPTDATTVDAVNRREALNAAMTGLEAYLAEHRIHLDLFGRLELLGLALDDLCDVYDAADLTPPPTH